MNLSVFFSFYVVSSIIYCYFVELQLKLVWHFLFYLELHASVTKIQFTLIPIFSPIAGARQYLVSFDHLLKLFVVHIWCRHEICLVQLYGGCFGLYSFLFRCNEMWKCVKLHVYMYVCYGGTYNYVLDIEANESNPY